MAQKVEGSLGTELGGTGRPLGEIRMAEVDSHCSLERWDPEAGRGQSPSLWVGPWAAPWAGCDVLLGFDWR